VLALAAIDQPFVSLATAVLRWFLGSDPSEAGRRMLLTLVPSPGAGSTLMDVGQARNPDQIESYCPPCISAYSALRPLGPIALALALLARMVTQIVRARDRGLSASHLLVDLGSRLFVGLGALQAGLATLDFISAVAALLAAIVAMRVLPVVAGIGNPLLDMLNFLVPGESMAMGPTELLFLLLLGYLVVIVVVSRAAIVLAVLSLPFAVPALLYSTDGVLGVLWLRLLLLSCAVPVTAVACLAVAILAARAGLELGPTVPFLPALCVLAAMWLTVKVMNTLVGTVVRNAAGGLVGIVRGPGQDPAPGPLRESARSDLRRALKVGRKGMAIASLMADGAVLRAPGPGQNGAFELFSATQFLRHGLSKSEGKDLGERDRDHWRNLFWAQYLAQEVAS
jgi:hypothetical protein